MATDAPYKLGLCNCGNVHNPWYISEARYGLLNELPGTYYVVKSDASKLYLVCDSSENSESYARQEDHQVYKAPSRARLKPPISYSPNTLQTGSDNNSPLSVQSTAFQSFSKPVHIASNRPSVQTRPNIRDDNVRASSSALYPVGQFENSTSRKKQMAPQPPGSIVSAVNSPDPDIVVSTFPVPPPPPPTETTISKTPPVPPPKPGSFKGKPMIVDHSTPPDLPANLLTEIQEKISKLKPTTLATDKASDTKEKDSNAADGNLFQTLSRRELVWNLSDEEREDPGNASDEWE